MCHYVCVIMHIKDPYLSVVRVGHCVPLAGFCLSLYDLHALNRDVNMIQTNKQNKKICRLMCFYFIFDLFEGPLKINKSVEIMSPLYNKVLIIGSFQELVRERQLWVFLPPQSR